MSKLKSGLAVPFHQKVCSYCHSVPRSKDWLVANITDELNVFHVGKRHKPYQRWEPIYIGTQSDPLYDERLTWEGKSDKMTQVSSLFLCSLSLSLSLSLTHTHTHTHREKEISLRARLTQKRFAWRGVMRHLGPFSNFSCV